MQKKCAISWTMRSNRHLMKRCVAFDSYWKERYMQSLTLSVNRHLKGGGL